jgi:hypothetical protein
MGHAKFGRLPLKIVSRRWVQRVTRITIGVGTVATLVSVDQTDGLGHAAAGDWKVVGLVGVIFVMLSLPPQSYDLYMRLRSRGSYHRYERRE